MDTVALLRRLSLNPAAAGRERRGSDALSPGTAASDDIAGSNCAPNHPTVVAAPPVIDISPEPFSGNRLQYRAFIAQFQNWISRRTTASGTDKLIALLKHLRGEPKELVAALGVHDAAFEAALQMLDDNYGKVDIERQQIMSALLNTPRVSSSSNIEALRSTINRVRASMKTLEALGVREESYSLPLSQVIRGVVPQKLLFDYAEMKRLAALAAGSCVAAEVQVAGAAAPSALARESQVDHHATAAAEDVRQLLDFLTRYVALREETALASQQDHTEANRTSPSIPRRQTQRPAPRRSEGIRRVTTAVPAVSRAPRQLHTPGRLCFFCKSALHLPSQCDAPITFAQRLSTLKTQKRCAICFRGNHRTDQRCPGPLASCNVCKTKLHYTSMHPPSEQDREGSWQPQPGTSAPVGAIAAAKGCSPPTFLYLASAYVVHGRQRTPVRLFFDAGSTMTFVSPALVRQIASLVPLHRAELDIDAFASSHRITAARYKLLLESSYGDERAEIYAYEHDFRVNPSTECTERVRSAIKRFQATHNLADRALTGDAPTFMPAILIGFDQFYSIAHLGREQPVIDGVVAKSTRFGWILGGPMSTTPIKAHLQRVQLHCCSATVASAAEDVEQLWKLEQLGIQESTPGKLTADEEAAVAQFRSSVCLENGNFTVGVPKRSTIGSLENNKQLALKRLHAKLRQLSRDKGLFARYDEEIMSFVREGHAEEICGVDLTVGSGCDGCYYMPHHQVVTENNGVEKWRIVFDCSSADTGVGSLNHHLLPGPNLNPDLLAVLMNFRLHPVALSADITRAYLRIYIQAQDRRLFRFVWQGPKESEPRVYQMKKVVWGAAPSGYLLAATLRHHFKGFDPENAYRTGDHLYHDDFLRSFVDAHDAKGFIDWLTRCLADAGMELAKWKTNSHEVSRYIRQLGADDESLRFDEETVLPVLGIAWSPHEDVIRILAKKAINGPVSEAPLTKRAGLRLVASVFDPMGVLNPFVLRGKLLLQRLWALNLDWDSRMDEALSSEFRTWALDVQELFNLRIPRCYASTRNCPASRHLHIFADASVHAFATVAYLQTNYEDGNSDCSFIMSKSRVAPRNKVTIPRLELLAAVLAARMKRYICGAMKLAIEKVFLYTDSMVTYFWCISRSPGRWKTFVANRVTEIQELTVADQWRFVQGSHNICDLATRGVSARELLNTTAWLHGPDWLRLPAAERPTSQPSNVFPKDMESATSELRGTVVAIATTSPLLSMDKFSSLERAIRVLSCVLKFTERTRRNAPTPDAGLCRRAELLVIKWAQQTHFKLELEAVAAGDRLPRSSKLAAFSLFADNEGLLRAKTRLTQGPFLTYDEKNPVVIPNQSRLAALLILREHRINAHFGVNTVLNALRRRFWIVRARQLVKAVLAKCVICRKRQGPSGDQPIAPLPESRVTLLTPFGTTGVDFCGPFFVRTRDGTAKSYVALFTCTATRAIHLELVPSMTTPQTHLAIRRFLAIYPGCRAFISDNGRSFVKAATEIKRVFNSFKDPEVAQLLSQRRISWNFTCPHAPWHGGFFERLVGTVKRSLAKTLGRSLITAEEFRTVLLELAAVINDRPLTHVSADSNDPSALTPSHLIKGGIPSTALCSVAPLDQLGSQAAVAGSQLRDALRTKSDYFKHLSVRWQREYIMQLRSANAGQQGRTRPISEGDVCLLREDNVPRVRWKLVRVVKCHCGRDGLNRTCTIRFASGGTSRRAVQLLIPLEVF